MESSFHPQLKTLTESQGIQELEKAYETLLDEGLSLRDLLNYSDKDMQAMYSFSKEKFDLGRLDEACTLFNHLIMIDPFTKEHWLGLALTKQKQKNFEEAIASFEILSEMEEDPTIDVQLALCYLEIQEQDKAKTALEKAVEKAHVNHDYRSVEDMARALLYQLN